MDRQVEHMWRWILEYIPGYHRDQQTRASYCCRSTTRHKRSYRYQTGDLVRAMVPERLACRGTHVGRVAVKANGFFTITTAHGKVTDVPHRFCRLIGRATGYHYQAGEQHATQPPTSP